MDDAALRELIDQMAAGEVDADEVVRRLREAMRHWTAASPVVDITIWPR